MRLAVLFSGGKDSVFAAFWAEFQGFEPFLITVVPQEYSMMFHHPNVHLTPMQADLMGMEQSFLHSDDDSWEENLIRKLREISAEGIVTGAVASEYQRWQIASVANRLGIPDYSPLWHKEEELFSEMLDHLEIYITAVSAEGLGEEHLGKPLSGITRNPPPHIHPFLEGGEGETFVAYAPFFSGRIRINRWSVRWDGIRGVAEIVEASLKTAIDNQ